VVTVTTSKTILKSVSSDGNAPASSSGDHASSGFSKLAGAMNSAGSKEQQLNHGDKSSSSKGTTQCVLTY